MILFVIFMIATAGDRKKKKGSADPKAGATAAAQRQAAAARLKAAKQARFTVARTITIPKQTEEGSGQPEAHHHSEPVIEVMNRAEAVQGASMLDDADCAGGSMAHTHAEGHSGLEDEDCVGGSMDHTHTEGVSRAAQARRMAAIDAAQNDDGDILPRTIDERTLRRAVVMAEVLGKPRALRKF